MGVAMVQLEEWSPIDSGVDGFRPNSSWPNGQVSLEKTLIPQNVHKTVSQYTLGASPKPSAKLGRVVSGRASEGHALLW